MLKNLRYTLPILCIYIYNGFYVIKYRWLQINIESLHVFFFWVYMLWVSIMNIFLIICHTHTTHHFITKHLFGVSLLYDVFYFMLFLLLSIRMMIKLIKLKQTISYMFIKMNYSIICGVNRTIFCLNIFYNKKKARKHPRTHANQN